MVIGLYVGFATVGIFVYWYTADVNAADNHTLVSLSQLSDWGNCDPLTFSASIDGIALANPCEYFTKGTVKASTLSLTGLCVCVCVLCVCVCVCS